MIFRDLREFIRIHPPPTLTLSPRMRGRYIVTNGGY